ncbi:MAG: pyridoxal-phosphate dependent enzyme [Phycisphaerales bacterium]|nr:pyridoxal-phosphate dependent enzyme [Phycisphaerales bacterium]
MPNREKSRDLPLFQAYPRLAEAIPRLPLGNWPTPVTHTRHFAEEHGIKTLYVKREDLSHSECGGNKVRGLEFLLAEAKRRRTDTILTFSSAGSHHICKTACHADNLGMNTMAFIVRQPIADYVRRNLQAGLSRGVIYVPANYVTILPKLAWCLLKNKISTKHETPPYIIPPGGTSPLSCIGHVNAAFELKRQIDAGVLPEPDYLYGALGSLGTMAGLALGCKLAGLKVKLIGVVVSYRWYCTPNRWAKLAMRTLDHMQTGDTNVPKVVIDPAELTVIRTSLGRGYAHFTESSANLARRFFDLERIQLDGTYTAKTLHGALRFIGDRALHDKVHLFWHSFHAMPPAIRIDLNALEPNLKQYFIEDKQPFDD